MTAVTFDGFGMRGADEEWKPLPARLSGEPVGDGIPHASLDSRNALLEEVARAFDAFHVEQARLEYELAAAIGRLMRPAQAQSGLLEVLSASGALDGVARPAAAPRRSRAAVFCLGAFRLVLDGLPVADWRAGTARALFQYLVTHLGRPVPREELIDALWPSPDAAAAGTSLKVAVHALRQALGQAGAAGQGGVAGTAALAVVAHDAGYALEGPDVWLDVAEFERSYALGRRLEGAGQAEEALACYTRAADLYTGDFLAESRADWAVFRREALTDRFLFVLGRLADAAFAAEDYPACVARCQQVLEKDRCREDAYRLLMLCHARLGQRGRVRRWYELCVGALQAELEVPPDPETERLYHQALRGTARS
jgi:DNA-binding SARP family transcriptional activator